VFLALSGRCALVVGGGAPAAAKARLLLKAGARLTVVAPALGRELAGLAARGEVRALGRAFAPADVLGAALVVGASGRLEVDAQVADAARAQAIPVNVVDRADLSTFIMPAIVDRDPLVVAISSGGAAPALARRLRQSIEALLPARLGRLARFAESFRAALKANLPEAEGRRRFWERFFDGPVAAAVLDGDQRGAAEAMLALVNRPAAAARRDGAVHLVTAVAGAPDLLSLRALRLLQRADLVVHDEPIDPVLLDYLRRGAERLPVPAAAEYGEHERAIAALMARQARSGKLVVRLREGDPLALEPGAHAAPEDAVAV
jgi:uroporphyrin-III C-methyltransferase/precorrin-2 dehydrogenase/sirohydrochlorin ferrochelatase